MQSPTVVCPKCSAVDEYWTSESGPHLKATCTRCGSYIKFLPKLEAKALHFGKYAGRPIAEISDASYLQWLLKSVKLSTSVRYAVENRLQTLNYETR